MGYGHIAAAHAEAIEGFYEQYFNPYLNFHRPCGVAEIQTDTKGKQRRVYRWYATPWEILRQLPNLAGYLRPEVPTSELGTNGGGGKRHGSSAEDAGGQTEAVCGAAAKEDGMKQRAVEMTHSPDEARKSGKRKTRFPLSRSLFSPV